MRYIGLIGVVLLGVATAEAAGIAWSYIARQNPMGHYILDNLGESSLFYPILFLHDLAINFILLVPGVILMTQFIPAKSVRLPVLFGFTMYIWSFHVTAFNFGFPIIFHPTSAFSATVLLLVPLIIFKLAHRGTHVSPNE